jgi:hypothetical protein
VAQAERAPGEQRDEEEDFEEPSHRRFGYDRFPLDAPAPLVAPLPVSRLAAAG